MKKQASTLAVIYFSEVYEPNYDDDDDEEL